MQDLWFGYLQLNSYPSSGLWFIGVDLLATTAVVFLALLSIATPKGWRYLGITTTVLFVFVGSSLFNLPALHLVVQFLLVVLAILLPILFHEEWIAWFNRKEKTLEKRTNIGFVLIISLTISTLIGVFSVGISSKTAQLPQEIPVAPVNMPEGLSARIGVEKVKVVVTAPRDVWGGLSEDSLTATVDLGQRKEGTYDIQVAVTSKVDKVTVRRIEPKNIVVTVEPIIVKTVPVGVKFSGQAINGLVPDSPVITPDKVEVTGPKSLVTSLTQVSAEVNISGLSAPINQNYALVALDSEGKTIKTISANPLEANVSVKFIKAGKLKTVGIRPTLIGQPAQGYWVSELILTPPAVTITGAVDVLEKVTQIVTEPVDLTGIDKETTKQVSMSLPSGVTVADATQKIGVQIKIANSLSQKQVNPVLKYDNLNGALKVTGYTPLNINVLVIGPSGLLNTIDGKIELGLNLSSYKSAGTYAISITRDMFIVPEGATVVSFLPSTIDVTLENK